MKLVTKVYDSYLRAKSALSELRESGVSAAEIGLLVNKDVSDQYTEVDDSLGTAADDETGVVVAGPAARIAGVGPVVVPDIELIVATGWFATTAHDAGGGGKASGIVEILMSAGVLEEHTERYAEAVRKGGILLSVQVDDLKLGLVRKILNSQLPLDLGLPSQ